MPSIDVIMILDASGSMYDLRFDTIGAFNMFIDDQRREPGDVYVTLVTFDDAFNQRYAAKPLAEVPKLDEAGYMGGHGNTTALHDAVGKALANYDALPVKADKTIFVIDTDGFENASQEWTYESVRTLIKRRRQDGWAFVFLGANDSEWQGERISSTTVGAYVASARGITAKYDTVGRNLRHVRARSTSAETAAAEVDWTSRED